ncbi:MAG: hypothetical protein HGA65_01135 [Oscillochloris sp.]|nr:hypothetical protein [Oscillochloris sp.]
MKTAMHRITAAAVVDGSSVSFDDMGADLHALYSAGTVNVRTLATDLHALYGDTQLPVNLSDILGELHELYGDEEVAWPDFSKDFEALYTNHAI